MKIFKFIAETVLPSKKTNEWNKAASVLGNLFEDKFLSIGGVRRVRYSEGHQTDERNIWR